ncbi:MAG: 50S ribosomal protein L5 [Calditrichaeota bacterium]|nr:MAG: 50S ribosomal protein L5 [Calditrichota bacterium]
MSTSNPRLATKYSDEIAPEMQKGFGYKNVMQVPKVEKIVINLGVGDAVQNSKLVDSAAEDLGVITGQKPVIRRAKKAISNFKVREGMPIGCTVTLRGAKMYEFLDRFISLAVPRVRDFRGLPVKGFDGRGNYNLGIKEQTIFPEIEYDKIDKVRGMNLTIVTTAKTDEEAFALLQNFGIPFVKKKANN